MSSDPRMEDFLAFSSTLTGFSAFELRGTGQAGAYLATLEDAVDADTVADLLATFGQVRATAGGNGPALERDLRRELMSDATFGPLARNVIKLWYVGTWHALPAAWRDAHGMAAADHTHVVSATAYTEGLLWPAVGANPPGAKPFGYGMWAAPPRVGAEGGTP